MGGSYSRFTLRCKGLGGAIQGCSNTLAGRVQVVAGTAPAARPGKPDAMLDKSRKSGPFAALIRCFH
jgi:hypothetical protein